MIDMDGDDGGAVAGASGGASGGASQMQQQMQQLALIDETDSYIQERSDAMQNIESTVVELGQIFTQLATMVKEQEEMIQRYGIAVHPLHMYFVLSIGTTKLYAVTIDRTNAFDACHHALGLHSVVISFPLLGSTPMLLIQN